MLKLGKINIRLQWNDDKIIKESHTNQYLIPECIFESTDQLVHI